jgi:acyl-coenzyme A synthetase/AMP-(fatty) acid ligase
VEVHDGRLTVVGRLKDIVNRSGLKIALAEIDEALDGLDGAAETACFGVPDADTGERLVVAARPADGASVTLDMVIAHLRNRGVATRKLPEELVVWHEPLPRTASGKIVRPRLARESGGRPRTAVERLRSVSSGADQSARSADTTSRWVGNG